MKGCIRVILVLFTCYSAYAQPAPSTADIQQAEHALRQSQHFTTNPQYQKQLEVMQEHMQKQGIAVGHMPPIDTRKMDAKAQMHECVVRNIGNEALTKMDEKHQEVMARIKALCREKNRKEAEIVSKDYIKEMKEDIGYKALKACAAHLGDTYKYDTDLKPMREQIKEMEGRNRRVCP